MSSSLSPADLSYPQQLTLQKYSSSPLSFCPQQRFNCVPSRICSHLGLPQQDASYKQVGYSSSELSPRLVLISTSPVCRELASPMKLHGYAPSGQSGCSYLQARFIPQPELASRFDRLQQISDSSLSARRL